MSEPHKLKFAKITALVTDPSRPPSLKLFFGYVGKSSDTEFRIYLDATLSTYLAVPRSALAYQVQFEEPTLLELSAVWVHSNAVLSFGPADFLPRGCTPCHTPCLATAQQIERLQLSPPCSPGCTPCQVAAARGCTPCQVAAARGCTPCPSPQVPTPSWGEF